MAFGYFIEPWRVSGVQENQATILLVEEVLWEDNECVSERSAWVTEIVEQ